MGRIGDDYSPEMRGQADWADDQAEYDHGALNTPGTRRLQAEYESNLLRGAKGARKLDEQTKTTSVN